MDTWNKGTLRSQSALITQAKLLTWVRILTLRDTKLFAENSLLIYQNLLSRLITVSST